MRLRNFRRVLCGSLFCIPLTAANAQTIWYVNDDAPGANNGTSWTDAYTDLRSALAAAQSGDQIWVAAGRYVGNFTLALGVEMYGGFAGTETELAKRNWKTNSTILDGNQTGSVVTPPPGATSMTRIDGFTITNGNASAGGGLYLYFSSPTITNNTIMGNNAANGGGGLYLWYSSPTITNNTIRHNSNGSFSGALHLRYSSPMIANNAITGNVVALYLWNSSPTIANNTITANAQGLYLDNYSNPTIANSIIAFNLLGIWRVGGWATLRDNCVYGNGAFNYVGLNDPTGINGNISVDPRLVDPSYGNVHIQPDSPCVHAGDNAYAYGDDDIDGEPRIQPLGGTVDIGADESDGTVWPPGPYTIVRVSRDGDDEHDGSSWSLAKRTVQAGIDAAAALGGQVWVQGGTYYERIALHPYVYVYGGFAGFETWRDERDWGLNVTTLDGQQQGSVVTARVWDNSSVSAIDGFTITNGTGTVWGSYTCGGGLFLLSSSTVANNTIIGNSARDGGGMYLAGTSPTIANNTITGNRAGNWGGGLYLEGSFPTIANNTIAGNGAGDGGGLYMAQSSPTIANTIIAFNSSGIYLDQCCSGIPTLRYNCVYGNTEYDYSGLSDPTGTDGNISSDPQLVGLEYGNVHIQPDSPCVDAGSNANAFGDFDVDGQLRILPPGGEVDIGADESDGTLCPTGPYVIVRVSPLGDDANDGSSWALAKRTVQGGIDATCAGGGEVWIQGGTYYELITLHPHAFIYGGFAGNETRRDERDLEVHATILDGQRLGSVVTSISAHRISGVDGFTITNGSNSKGGGLYLYHSSPTIANNTITGNSAFDGGGAYLDSSYPTVTNNTIMGNSAHNGGGGLALRGSSPTIANNTITGNSAEYGGGLVLGGSSPTIANNTITGNSAADYEGGGLYLDNSSPAIADNTITGNSASNLGGGLYVSHSSPTITNNTITGNSANGGGGLALRGSSPTIANNTITGNSAEYGGGMWLYSASPIIANNTITGNSADYSGGGLGLYSSSPTIANNTISGNRAVDGGGGMWLYSASPIIANNTITANGAFSGGDLWMYSASPTIANNIFAFNSSGIFNYIDEWGQGTPTLRYNCVYGNTEYDYSNLPDPTGTDGNISADPTFVRNPSDGGDGWGDDPATPGVDEGANDDYGDLQLRSGSPAINTGDPSFVPQPGETDLDGHARVLCGRVDMGAYEFGIGDHDCDRTVTLADFAAWDACMTGPGGAELRMGNGEDRMTQTFDPVNRGSSHFVNRQLETGILQLSTDNRQSTIDNSCAAFDFDADGDTDLADFAGYQRLGPPG